MSQSDTSEKKSGPYDDRYGAKDQDYVVKYEQERKQAVRKFGKSKGDA